jgi:hexulose-6-phosphate isomerase
MKKRCRKISWPERLVLAKSCGFDFVEMSVDETDERLSRLDGAPRSAPRW